MTEADKVVEPLVISEAGFSSSDSRACLVMPSGAMFSLVSEPEPDRAENRKSARNKSRGGQKANLPLFGHGKNPPSSSST